MQMAHKTIILGLGLRARGAAASLEGRQCCKIGIALDVTQDVCKARPKSYQTTARTLQTQGTRGPETFFQTQVLGTRGSPKLKKKTVRKAIMKETHLLL